MVRGISGASSHKISVLFGKLDFPCDKGELISHARNQKVDKQTLDVLERLPDQRYTGTTQILQNIPEDI